MKLGNILSFLPQRKGLSVLITVAVVGGGYLGVSLLKAKEEPPRYVLGKVEKGTLITSISGTGQVSVSNQVDIQSKVSGEVRALYVKEGDVVKTGTVLAQLDSSDAAKAVRDAQINLETAQLALKKLQAPADNLSLIQAENSYKQAKRNLDELKKPPATYDLLQAQNAAAQAQRDFDQAKTNSDQQAVTTTQSTQSTYENAYNSISSTFLDVPDMIIDLQSVQTSNTQLNDDRISAYKFVLGSNSPFISTFLDDYTPASQQYAATFNDFKTTLRTSDQSVLYQLLSDSLDMTKAVAKNLQDANNMLDAIATKQSDPYYASTINSLGLNSLRSTIQGDISSINTHITALQNAKDSIDTTQQNSPLDSQKAKDAIAAAQERLNEKQEYVKKLIAGATSEDLATAEEQLKEKAAALQKLKDGPTQLDLQSQQLTIQQKQQALADAQAGVADYAVKAPFDGTIAKVSVQKGDTASSGTAIVTAITNQFIAQISLNEVDAAAVQTGNKATLTFDAITDLSISGAVVQLDTIGTATQGVVTYGTQIAFDTQDARIKPGMSVSASIITMVKQDVLLVPNSAVKSQGEIHYVEIFPTTTAVTNTSQTNTVTSSTLPEQKVVEIGSTNDTQTEITSGLAEGDQIVTQTLAGSSTSRTSTQSGASGLRIPGITGGATGGAGFTRNVPVGP